MPKTERTHETVNGLPSLEYLARKVQEGWKLVGLEWEREVTGSDPDSPATGPREWLEEIPYGLRVSDDCARLVESPPELEILAIALDMIADDCPLSRVADELNLRGYRTRPGNPWAPPALFNLLPRMIQVSPQLLKSERWTSHRKKVPKLT
ncbi:MAG: hypothetical protein ACLQVN_25395 [Bryobacteraceae bacterium]